LRDVIKLVQTINKEKIIREEKRQIRLAELKITRKSFIEDYLKNKSNEYINFIRNSSTLDSYYNGAFTDEEIIKKLDNEYEIHEFKINSKLMRRNDINSVIDKHEMVNYSFYKTNLYYRVEEYVNNEELSLVDHFLKIQTEYTRIKELYDAFSAYNIEPRLDSYLCCTYAKYGLSKFENGTNDMGNIKSVNDIASIMFAMDFLYTNTSYQKELNKIHKNKYTFCYKTDDLATIAKKNAVKKWLLDGNDVGKLPERLKRFIQ